MDQIEIYKDQILLDLVARMNMLDEEELDFLLLNKEVNENGRVMNDVNIDKISTLEQINRHLRNKYAGNKVSLRWLAINEFTIARIKEDIN
ncbi:MAG: hypothetical protein PHE24_06885 [Patescibacteria group bacterium]|nr:hypothetical protein [Patescibacteria group bacterium]